MSHLKVFSPDNSQPEQLTTREAIELYLAEKSLHNQAGIFTSKSLKRAQYYLRSFVNHVIDGKSIGARPAGTGRNSDLTSWLLANPTWKGTATKSGAVGQVVTCFSWLKSEGYCENPYTRPKFLGSPSRPRPAITPAEYRSIMTHARNARTPSGMLRRTRNEFRAALIFLWKTGCRTSEMREARWEDLDWQRAVIELERHKTDEKTGDVRQIPVRRVLPLLRWLGAHKRGEHIFTNTLGRPWTCGVFAKEFRRYATLAGVRKQVSAYCLRHGLTVRLIEAGCSDRSIADVLGHTTTRYVSWYGRTTRTRSDHLNAVLKRDHSGKRGES